MCVETQAFLQFVTGGKREQEEMGRGMRGEGRGKTEGTRSVPQH
jgi:hypothetical protein